MQSTLLSAIGARDWLQPGLLVVVALVTWLIFKFAMPRVLDCLTPASEKLEVAAEIAGIMARQAAVRALSIAEARERMEKEVFFAGNQDVSWTERAPKGQVCDFPLPPAALEIFTRFESIQLSFGAAELSRERLQRLSEDWIEVGGSEDMGNLLLKASSGEVFSVWSTSSGSRRVEEAEYFAPSLYHAILMLGAGE